MARLVLGMVVMLLGAGPALAQGGASPTSVWERKSGDWTVSLTNGDRRCLMVGTTLAPVHQLRFIVRPGAPAPTVRPGTPAPARTAETAQRPMLELAENIGGVHVSAPAGTPLSLSAEGRGYFFQVVTPFPGGFRAVSTNDFAMDWARAREVFLDTGRAEALRLSPTGLGAAGTAMAECIAGRVPR